MSLKLTPNPNYFHGREVKQESGVVTENTASDHWQKYEILTLHPDGLWAYYEAGHLKLEYSVGDIVYVQKHGEADTPPDLAERDEVLILGGRIMAKVEE